MAAPTARTVLGRSDFVFLDLMEGYTLEVSDDCFYLRYRDIDLFGCWLPSETHGGDDLWLETVSPDAYEAQYAGDDDGKIWFDAQYGVGNPVSLMPTVRKIDRVVKVAQRYGFDRWKQAVAEGHTTLGFTDWQERMANQDKTL